MATSSFRVCLRWEPEDALHSSPVLAVAFALVLCAAVALSRYVSLRRLDDPVVVAYWFWVAFWIVGVGLVGTQASVPSPRGTTIALIVGSYVSFIVGSSLTLRLRSEGGNTELPPAGETWKAPTRREATSSCILFVAGGVLWLAFVVRAGIPLLGENAEQARVDSRYGAGYLVLAAIWLLTLSAATLTGYAYASSARWRHVVWFIVAGAAVMIGTFGNRGPMLELVIAALGLAIQSRGRLPSWRLIAAGLLGAFLFLAVAAALRAGESVTLELVLLRMRWLTIVNVLNLDRLMAFIPEVYPWLGGQSYARDLAVLLPGHQPNFSEWLKEAMSLTFPGGGLTIGLVGESYANWGPLASLGMSGLYGAALALWTTSASVRRVSSPVRILFALGLGAPIQSGFAPTLVNNLVPLVMASVAAKLCGAAIVVGQGLVTRQRGPRVRNGRA
jgi:hypothetical protein